MFHSVYPKITLFSIISSILLVLFLAHASALSSSHASFIQPFSLADVDLDESSDFFQGQALNHDYLLILDVDNLLYNFRKTAGLPAPGQSYGGWEGSNVEVRGQFIGHYLSALAFAFKSTDNLDFQIQADDLISGLAECQAAHGDGYLSAFPKEHFDRLEALKPVWAPFYVIHKLMQGLLDQYQLTAQPQALEILSSLAKFFCTWSTKVISDHGMDHWQQVLENEFGGMNDVLYKLAIEAEKKARENNNKNKDIGEKNSDGATWAACAALFDKPAWFDPLVQGQDVLTGLHANTHLAQVNGFASRFEATGDKSALAAVANFFNIVTQRHSYSTGGNNWYEHWGNGQSLGDAIDNADAAANTQESCTTYNILKIARSLFTWTARAEFADFYERAILNGVLGIQRTSSTAPTLHYHGHHNHDHSMHSTHTPNLHLHSESNLEHNSAGVSLLTETDRAKIAASHALHAAHPRPAEYRVVSWPDDPASNITSATFLSSSSNRGSINDEPGQPGQFIYYMPLGHEGGKGENPRAWTHGWGDRFNTFWCCYGTAVESFSKLADSIYFSYIHPSPPSSSPSSSSQERGGVYPILFVNQFVSSTLKWKIPGSSEEQQGENMSVDKEDKEERMVVLKQTADLYSSNVATSTVVISVPSPPSSTESNADSTNSGSTTTSISASSSVKFYLYWRMPSWLKQEEESMKAEERNETEDGQDGAQTNKAVQQGLKIRINGKTLNIKTLPRLHNSDISEENTINIKKQEENETTKLSSLFSRQPSFLQLPLSSSFTPPKFGKDTADYTILGPEWEDGDIIEVDMPMKITTEDLNDSRPEKQNLKAVMMGPFQMAGLTENGDREIDTDPEDVENAVTVLENMENDDKINSSSEGGMKINKYPKGARLLSGKTKKYVIAPIGQLIDEKYTAYFDFVPVGPSEAAVARQ